MPTIRTILLVVGVPALLLGGVVIGLERLESDFRSALIAEFGPIPPEQANELRLSTLCERPEVRSELPVCGDALLGRALMIVGALSVALSILTLVLTVGVTRWAGRDRDRLATLFKPGLIVLQLIVVVLILSEGALAVGGGYLLEVGFTGGYHPVVLLSIGFVALLAAWGVIRAMLAIGGKLTAEANGVPVDPIDQPRLAAFAAEVADAVGTRTPDAIVLGLDPTFYVTEADVTTLEGPRSGRILYLSLPLARVLTVEELRAVLCHEMGHFKGEDTRYSQRFAPVYRSAIDAFVAVSGAARGFYGLVLLPSLEILGLFMNNFAEAERAVQRQRELEADTVGAATASARDLATSLIKLQAFVPLWLGVLNQSARAVGLGKPPTNPSHEFAKRVAQGASAPTLDALEGTIVPHPTDSHPPLGERLANVGVDYESVAEGALAGSTVGPAIDLVGDVAAIEDRLTADLVSKFRDDLGLAGPGFDTEVALRELAQTEPAVASAIELIERAHAGTLLRAVDFGASWRAVLPLAIAPHPNPRAFLSAVDVATLPPGDQQLVVGFATSETPADQVLTPRSLLKPIGLNDPSERKAGYAEDVYVGDRVIVVQGVGSGTLPAQLAGMFLVPSTDPLATPRGAYAIELDELRTPLLAWQAAFLSSPDRDGGGESLSPQPDGAARAHT